MESKKLTKVVISNKSIRKLRQKASIVDYDGAGDGIRTRDTLLGRQELFR